MSALQTMEEASRSVIRDSRLHRLDVERQVLEEVPRALDRLRVSRSPARLIKTTIHLSGHVPHCIMGHHYLDVGGLSRQAPMWRRFLAEPGLQEISLWLRDDGEIVFNVKRAAVRTRKATSKVKRLPTKAYPLDFEDMDNLLYILEALRRF